MIIDFHTHMREGQGVVEDFIRAMDENNIDIAVVSNIVRSAQHPPEEVNEFLYRVVQKYPDRLIGFACVMPQQDGAAELLEHYVHDFGFKGLKLHPPIQDFSPADPSISPVIEKAIELDIPILIHTGEIFVKGSRLRYGDPVLVDELALAHPKAKIVIAHGDPLGDAPCITGKHENVYMDTTIRFARLARLIPGLAEEALEWMSTGVHAGRERYGGAARLIYGSDTNPLKTWRFGYNLDPILKMQIPEEAREQILWKNAASLLKLEL